MVLRLNLFVKLHQCKHYPSPLITQVLTRHQSSISPQLSHQPRIITPVQLSPLSLYLHSSRSYGPSATITPSGCVMSRQSRCMHGSERANSSALWQRQLCCADSADVKTVEEPVQPRQKRQPRQSLQTRGITSTLTILTALTHP